MKKYEHHLEWKFRKAYANMPLDARTEIICIISGEPMTPHVIKMEVDGKTELGYKAIERLVKIGVIK